MIASLLVMSLGSCEKKDDSVHITSITLDKSALVLTVGDEGQLAAIISPAWATNKNITWSSGNTAIASVNETGLVTALSPGTTTVVVTAEDGGFRAECNVIINARPVPVTGVTLNEATLGLTVGETETLTATVTPEDATNNEITWTSSKPEVATVDEDGKVTAVAEGTATITVTTDDGDKTATCEVTVTAGDDDEGDDPGNVDDGSDDDEPGDDGEEG